MVDPEYFTDDQPDSEEAADEELKGAASAAVQSFNTIRDRIV